MSSSSLAPAARPMALVLLVALAASLLAPPASADPLPSYCNWSGCNGVVEGGPWCNKNLQRCEGGCGGQWCVDGGEAPPTPAPPIEGGAGYCSWDSCSSGEAQGGDWCNESEDNCVIGCGNGAVWCTSHPSTTAPTPAATTEAPTPAATTEAPTSAPTPVPTSAPTGTTGPTPAPTTPPPPAPTTPPPPTGGYCNWNSCNGEPQGGEWCNGNEQQCVACGSGSLWCSGGDGGGPPSPTPPVGSGKGTLKATHFWDCSGAACDAKTLQPWDPSRYRYSAMYAPLDPNQYQGGAWYGEKMWMTGAASDILSEMMGPDDSCCGQDSEDIGGCGKCLLVTNPSAVNSDWKAVVMKKNRCPPWATGCDKAHMDIAVPGYDNLQYSLANICGQSDTIISKAASSVCGDWYNFGGSTIQGCSCSALPDSTEHEAALKGGCEMFTAWGWTSGNPTLEFEVVECPSEFVSVISASFGPSGPIY